MTSGAARANQRSRILGLLIAARGDWVSLLSIKAEACQYNARILELRRLGFQIENKIREIDGGNVWFRMVRMSWFRIDAAPPKAPSELGASRSVATAPETASSFPEFGRMAVD